MNSSDFDKYIITNMPRFISVSYLRILESKSHKEKLKNVIHTYNMQLRILTLALVSQYLTRDRERISDSKLNRLLLEKFPHMTPDSWVEILFAMLRSYENKQSLFFVPDIYNFYWDSSTFPHKPILEIEQCYKRLTQIDMELTRQPLSEDLVRLQDLSNEAFLCLRYIFEKLSFLSDYDLIRVLDYVEEDDHIVYQCELHKGIETKISTQTCVSTSELTIGWFYLHRDGKFLPLHPLLISFEHDEILSDYSSDAGVYDIFMEEKIRYILVNLLDKRTLNNKRVTDNFISLIYETIYESKNPNAYKLDIDWFQMRDACREITKRQVAAVKNKYQENLYLEREETKQAFNQFINSDKQCFVLIGKSGVGKSNFLLALADDQYRYRGDICFLMYDGAFLNVDRLLEENIVKDLKYEGIISDLGESSIWREIDRIHRIYECKFVLCIDAINENPNSKELLIQLDSIAREARSWLKVVFSCRPDNWQSIKQGVKLSEDRYYREEDSGLLGVLMSEFTYSTKIKPFSRQELPDVYSKYQTAFKISTPYAVLKERGDICDIIQDPLSLRLISNTYEGEQIPTTLKVTKVIEEYIQSVLTPKELELLEDKIVPLMVQGEDFTNSISVDDIKKADNGLLDDIYSQQELSDGSRYNQQFVNLVDADILTRKGEGRKQSISFTYERFYEYFIGKILFARITNESSQKKEASWKKAYLSWSRKIKANPYLWGAVKRCLESHLEALDSPTASKLCLSLCKSEDQYIEEILIMALTDYGRDDNKKVENIVIRLLSSNTIFSSRCPSWKRVAMIVAVNLNIDTALELALSDNSRSVRVVAIRNAFIYWRRNRKAGTNLLRHIVSKSIGFMGLPIINRLESAIGLSLLIRMDDYSNIRTTATLRQIWKPAVQRLLRLATRAGSGSLFNKSFRVTMITLLTSFSVSIASLIPLNSFISVIEFKDFYKKDRDFVRRKENLRKIIEYMDTNKDINDISDIILSLSNERDAFTYLIATIMLNRHTRSHPETTLPILNVLFQEGIKSEEPGPFCLITPTNAICAVDPELTTQEGRDLYIKMVTTYLDRFKGIVRFNRRQRRMTWIDAVSLAEQNEIVDAPLGPIAKEYVNKIIYQHDTQWMIDFIRKEVTNRSIQAGHLQFAFGVLEMLINVDDIHVKEAVIELLAKLRVYYPNEVDDFMSIANCDNQFVLSVRKKVPSENIGDLIGFRILIFWQKAIVLNGSPQLWERVNLLLQQIPECKSLDQWLNFCFQFAVNEIYGKVIFDEIS